MTLRDRKGFLVQSNVFILFSSNKHCTGTREVKTKTQKTKHKHYSIFTKQWNVTKQTGFIKHWPITKHYHFTNHISRRTKKKSSTKRAKTLRRFTKHTFTRLYDFTFPEKHMTRVSVVVGAREINHSPSSLSKYVVVKCCRVCDFELWEKLYLWNGLFCKVAVFYEMFCFVKCHCLMSLFLLFLSQLDDGKEYQYTPPTQLPIRPPYEQACHLRRNNLLSREDAPSNQSQDETELPAKSTLPKWLLLTGGKEPEK